MQVASIEAQLRNAPAVLEHVEAALRAGAQHDAGVALAGADQLRGWALAALGDSAGARAAYADRGATWRSVGQRFGLPGLAVLRAESALRDGDLDTANAALATGFAHAQRTGERRHDSELHRLRAECLRRAGEIRQAAVALEAALAVAVAQGARLAELRAAIDHVRLQRTAPTSATAARRLAAVVESFAPAEPLPELDLARDLLLSHSSAA
jgi:predicted ATPase